MKSIKYDIVVILALLLIFITGCAKKNHTKLSNIDPAVWENIINEIQQLDKNTKPPRLSISEEEIIVVYAFQKMPYVTYMGKKRNFLKGAWNGISGATTSMNPGSGPGVVLAVPIILGIGAVVGVVGECFVPSGGPVSEDFAQKVAEVVNDEEFDLKLKNQIEHSLRKKYSGNIKSYNGNSYSFNEKEIVPNNKQNILMVTFDVQLSGPEPAMQVTNSYSIFNKYALLRKNFTINDKDINTIISDINDMKVESEKNYKSFDFYVSPHYRKEEWLDNDGKLLKEKIHEAIEQMIEKMGQALF